MHQLSDEDLLKELAGRVEEKNRALFDLRMTTKKLEEVNYRLVESEALKGHFLSNIRNKINNPPAVIITMAGEIGAGESIPTAAQVDLRALVEETVSSFGPFAAAQGLELRTSREEDPGAAPLFTTDPAKLQLILANLLSNALKFGGGSDAVQVGVRRDADGLWLSVEDRGIGIDPADTPPCSSSACR